MAVRAKRSAKTPSRKLTPRTYARRSPEGVRLRAVAASFTVADITKSVAFYSDVLGFVVSERWEEAGALRGVRLKTGSCEFFLAQDDWKKGHDRAKGAGFRLLCQTVQEIDQLAESIKARGGTLAQEPMDQLWGARDLAVVDPDGFQITIYRPI